MWNGKEFSSGQSFNLQYARAKSNKQDKSFFIHKDAEQSWTEISSLLPLKSLLAIAILAPLSTWKHANYYAEGAVTEEEG